MKRLLFLIVFVFSIGCVTTSDVVQKTQTNTITINTPVVLSFHDALHSWQFPYAEIWGRCYEANDIKHIQISRRSQHLEYTILHEILHTHGHKHTKEFYNILEYEYGYDKKGERIK